MNCAYLAQQDPYVLYKDSCVIPDWVIVIEFGDFFFVGPEVI
jgi:hypothetical protein